MKKEEKKKKDGKKGIDKMASSEGKSLQKKNMSNLVAEVDVYGGLVKLSSRLEGKLIYFERPTHYPLKLLYIIRTLLPFITLKICTVFFNSSLLE